MKESKLVIGANLREVTGASASGATAKMLLVVTLIVSVGTPLLIFLGPDAVSNSNSELLLAEGRAQALLERTDRLVILFWWTIGVIGTFVFWALLRKWHGGRERHLGSRMDRITRLCATVICAFDVAALILSATWSFDPIGLWTGLPTKGLLAGAVIVAVVATVWFARRSALIRGAELMLIGLLATYTLPNIIQLPWALRDLGHFRFVADEVTAQAVGKFSLGNYAPTYEVLLGLPLAPVFKSLQSYAGSAVVMYLDILTLATLSIAIFVPKLTSGRRMILPTAIVVLAPVLAQSNNGLYLSSYSPVTPVRLILPLTTMTLALIVLVPKNGRSWQSRYILTLVLGWLCGITVINNLDFGLPLLAAVLISSFAASNKWKDAAVTALLIVTGCITFAITYVMLALFTANEVTWSLMLLFPSFHGLEGFFAFPMAPLGPHIAVATLFCITTVIGLGMSINKRHSISIRTRRQWLWMAMAGLWSLISLAYFSGRSYSSTLMAGSGLMVGVCLSSMLPAIRLSLRRAYRSVETHPKLDYVPALFGVLALLLVTGLWATVERPSAYIASAANQPWSLEGPMANIGNDVRSRIASAPVKVRSLIELGDVSQFLWNSNLVELSFPNLPSWGVGNSPQWMSISKKFLDLQCANPLPSETQYAWVSRQEIEAMMESEICTSQFSLGDLIPFSASSADVLVPTRRP